MHDKKDFIRQYLPKTVEDIHIAQIDLDVTGLTLCDILRNINTTFPMNGRNRAEIIQGTKVVMVITKSTLIEPFSGIILLVGHDIDIRVRSKNYLIIAVDEEEIRDEKNLSDLNIEIMVYIAEAMKGIVPNFLEFSNRCLYYDYEEKGDD